MLAQVECIAADNKIFTLCVYWLCWTFSTAHNSPRVSTSFYTFVRKYGNGYEFKLCFPSIFYHLFTNTIPCIVCLRHDTRLEKTLHLAWIHYWLNKSCGFYLIKDSGLLGQLFCKGQPSTSVKLGVGEETLIYRGAGSCLYLKRKQS